VHWDRLQTLAQTEVSKVLQALPTDLQAAATNLSITFQPHPNRELVEDGVDDDTLGLFIGDEWGHSESSANPLPPQIILFLKNIWEYAEGDERIFIEEIRTTLLHELGHYLGLDEDGLEQRGLD